ncbi:hypothetical protein, partial [Frigoribacterium sp. Leaf164]|uniref:hypothetical protein n=1 Tax=Frigoribacterium sp. Leaf164 TaxID=1736282 RepID=UPI00138F2856
MSTIRTGLTTVGLAALAVGAFNPAAAIAAPAPTTLDGTTVAAPETGTSAIAAPFVGRITPLGDRHIAVNGVAYGATSVSLDIPGGGGGVARVALDRFSHVVELEHLGKEATLVAYGPDGRSESVTVTLDIGDYEGEQAPVATPVVHAVSQYEEGGELVIEGTIVYDPLTFGRTLVRADVRGALVYDAPDENGAFSLRMPASYAGQTVDVVASRSSLTSDVATIELVPTEGNTASEVFPLEIESPAVGDVVTDDTTTFSGTAIPNSEIVVTRDAETGRTAGTLCETRVAASGDWSCTSTRLQIGSYETTVTETPTWKSAPTQTAGAAFSVESGLLPGEMPVTPQLSSVELDNTGELAVRVIAHNAGELRMTVDGEEIDTVGGGHGRFIFHVDPALLGETAVFTGVSRGVESTPLEASLTLLEAPAGAPLQAPLVHEVAELDDDDMFTIYATTSYFPDEYLVPGVIAKVGDEFIGASEGSWNGATFVSLDSEHAGEEIDLYTVRGDGLLSPVTTVTLVETDGNTAPEVFPLDVVSPKEGETVGADTRTFSGEGIPGSRILLAGDDLTRSAPLGSTSVLADGTWTAEIAAPLATGEQT